MDRPFQASSDVSRWGLLTLSYELCFLIGILRFVMQNGQNIFTGAGMSGLAPQGWLYHAEA